MAKKRNRITSEMSKTIAESSPLIKKTKHTILKDTEGSIFEVDINLLQNNPFQPRIDINMQSLNELISSIEQNGLLQPIVITQKSSNGYYTIIAGHRRYEAYKIMGKPKIQASELKNIGDKDLAILSLTENLMRENLHPIENAIAIKNILDNKIVESQNKLAEYVGLSKGYVSKLMNILKLPSSTIQKIKSDDYKDINILVLLNKLENEETMLKVYLHIKDLSRNEAEKYIKNNYMHKTKENSTFIKLNQTKSKLNFDIDIRELTEKNINEIKLKLETLKKELLLYKGNE